MLMQTLSSMVCSCIESKKSSLEGISSAADQTNSESTLKQSKRWLDSKWSDWESFFALYIVGVLNKAMPQGEIIRDDSCYSLWQSYSAFKLSTGFLMAAFKL